LISKRKLICLFFFAAAKILCAESDTLIVSSGVVLTGEIKSMKRNVLYMETDYSDSDFKIEWEKVREIYSSRNFVIFLSSNKKYYGKIRSDYSDKKMIIIRDADSLSRIIAELADIVYMDAVDTDFLSRLTLSLDLGFIFTKANNLRQLTTGANLGYITSRWEAEGLVDVLWNKQHDSQAVKRTDASAGFYYFILPAWYLFVSGNLLRNDELGLDLRATAVAGIGKYFLFTRELYLRGGLGVARTYESFSGSPETVENSYEGAVGAELDLFDVEDLSLFINVMVYPGISQKGRIRTDLRIDVKYDLPLDFYIRLGYQQNYDNRPVEGAAKDDYVFQTGIGWEL
jgi:hypothetical protein